MRKLLVALGALAASALLVPDDAAAQPRGVGGFHGGAIGGFRGGMARVGPGFGAGPRAAAIARPGFGYRPGFRAWGVRAPGFYGRPYGAYRPFYRGAYGWRYPYRPYYRGYYGWRYPYYGGYYRWGYPYGGAVAAGLVGGLALGALSYPYVYGDPYASPYYDVVYRDCYRVRRRIIDPWGRVVIRRVQVCY